MSSSYIGVAPLACGTTAKLATPEKGTLLYYKDYWM
jgi:hypothetical protein